MTDRTVPREVGDDASPTQKSPVPGQPMTYGSAALIDIDADVYDRVSHIACRITMSDDRV
ncbi:hypothetical protein GS538_09680 [Rhodococcus hoagii]|nr:hypothetical protein [Prescottella equi]